MDRKDRIDAFGATVLIIFSAMLGLNQVLVKLVNAGMGPLLQAGLRSACALVPVLIFALIMRRRITFSDGSLIPGIICGTLFAAEFMLLFQALEYTSVSRASVLFYTMPVWVALGAHYLIPGEGLTKARVVGLLLAVGGIVAARWRNETPATPNALMGDLMCLLAASFWAAIALIARTTDLKKSSPEMQLVYQLLVSAPIMLIAAWWTGDLIRELTMVHIGIFAFQVLGIVSIGFLTWFWILSIYPASDMASFGFLAPVFGVIFGWFILDETITPTIIAALALVGIGIVLVNRKPRPIG
jgi:drug/metabolite transporter (DMT)-like permease